MARKTTVTAEIGDYRYMVDQLPADDAFMLARDIIALMGVATSGDLRTAVSMIDATTLKRWRSTLEQVTAFIPLDGKGEGGKLSSTPEHFRGMLAESVEWMVFAIVAQVGDFLDSGLDKALRHIPSFEKKKKE